MHRLFVVGCLYQRSWETCVLFLPIAPPGRTAITALRGYHADLGAVRQHDENLRTSVSIGLKCDVTAVRRPGGAFVAARATRHLKDLPAAHLGQEDIIVRAEARFPVKGNIPPIG